MGVLTSAWPRKTASAARGATYRIRMGLQAVRKDEEKELLVPSLLKDEARVA